MIALSAADVSIVVPSYNSRKSISACLEALIHQEEPAAEIIVVDSSIDGTERLIQERFPQVQVRHFSRRTFPGPARNFGAQLAKGKIIAFTDADCIPAPDWVKRMGEWHSQGHQIVGGALEVGNPASRIAWAGHLGEFREFLPAGQPRPMLHVPTSNISYRKALFECYGGFPDAYYPQEDLLFNYLLNRNGISVWFDPQLRVRHFCREELRGYLSHQHRIGRVTRCTLRRIDLEGSVFARRAWLAWLSSPALGLIKLLRTSHAFTSSFPEMARKQPDLFGLILLGAVWWARGFASGARTGLSGVRGWLDPDEPIFNQILAAKQVVNHKECSNG